MTIFLFASVFQAPDTTTSIAPVSSNVGANAERTENLVYVRLIRKWIERDGTGWDVDVDRCLPENNGDLARINGCTFTYNLSVGIKRGFP